MLGLDTGEFLIVLLCALLIGLAKTGLPALGILVVAAMATIFPARDSIGIVLPMLIAADLIAVVYYRHSVHWKTLFSLVPWVGGGLIAGFILLLFITASRPIEVILGVIVLVMAAGQMAREKGRTKWLENIPKSGSFRGVIGTLAGFTTMIGNAAGPIMSIFLIAINLPKKVFIGTGAWFFLAVNLIKVPLYIWLTLITWETVLFNLWLVPVILAGAFLGIKFLPLIPQNKFNTVILFLAAAGGIQLLL